MFFVGNSGVTSRMLIDAFFVGGSRGRSMVPPLAVDSLQLFELSTRNAGPTIFNCFEGTEPRRLLDGQSLQVLEPVFFRSLVYFGWIFWIATIVNVTPVVRSGPTVKRFGIVQANQFILFSVSKNENKAKKETVEIGTETEPHLPGCTPNRPTALRFQNGG